MFLPRLSANIRAVRATLFGDLHFSFWEEVFLPKWVPLLLGIGLGLVLSSLIADEAWYFLIAATLAVPGTIVFIRYPFTAVLLWTLLMPFFLNEAAFGGRAMFWILHRAVIPVALVIAVLSNWLGISRQRLKRFGVAELSMVLFLALALVNIILTYPDPQETVVAFYDRFFVPFCMYWLVRLTAPGEKEMKQFLAVAFVTVASQCAIGLLGWIAPGMLPTQWVNESVLGVRTVGTLRNTAVFTSTLVLFGLMLLQYGMCTPSKRSRYLIYITFGLAAFCVFFSFSRGSWLGLSVVLFGLLLLFPKKTLRLVVMLGIISYLLGTTVFTDEAGFAYERLTGEQSETSAENRVISNNGLIAMVGVKPLFGWGYDKHSLYLREFLTSVGNIAAVQGYGISSHNTYLTVMVELGLIAFGLYMLPTAWWLWLSFRVKRKLPREGFFGQPLLIMLWLAVLHMFIVSNFMDMTGIHFFGTTLWWMALAFIANLVFPYLGSTNNGVKLYQKARTMDQDEISGARKYSFFHRRRP